MSLQSIYQDLGISESVLHAAEPVLAHLAPRFHQVDEIAEENQLKVVSAMQKALYPTHPYGTQTTIGTQEHLKNPSIFSRGRRPGASTDHLRHARTGSCPDEQSQTRR